MSSTTVAASRKHVELSLELKRKLIQEHEHGVPFTLLGKKYHIATSTAANIWRKKEFFLRSRMSGSRKRCNDRSKYKIVNQVTALFVKSMLERNHKIDGEVIKRFARTAAAQCNFKDFHGSNGWLDSFKKRENVCWVRRRGERAVAAAVAATTTTSPNGQLISPGAGPLPTGSQAAPAATGVNVCTQLTDQTHLETSSSTAGAVATSLAIANLAASDLRRSDSPNLSTAAAAAAVAASANQHDHHHHHHHHHHQHNHNNHYHNHFSHDHHHDHLQRQASFDDQCQCPSSSSNSSAHCCWEEESCPRCTVAAAAAAIAALNSSDSIHERDHEIEDWFHGIPFLCQFFEEYQNMHQQPQQQPQQLQLQQQPQQQQQQPQQTQQSNQTTSYNLDNFDQSRHLIGSDLYPACLQPAPTIEANGNQNRSPSSSSSSPSSSSSSSSTSISSMSSMAATSTSAAAAAGAFHLQAKSQYQHALHCQQGSSCPRLCLAANYQRTSCNNSDGNSNSSTVLRKAACTTSANTSSSESQTNLLTDDQQMFVVSNDLARQQQQQQQQYSHRHSSGSQPTLKSPFRSSSSSADVQSMGLQQTVLEADERRQVRTMSVDILSDLAVRQQQQRYATSEDDQHLNQVAHEQQAQYQTDYSMAQINGDQLMEVSYQEATAGGGANQEEVSSNEGLAEECAHSGALNSGESCLQMHSFKSEPEKGVARGDNDGGCCSSSSCSSLNHQQTRFAGPHAGSADSNNNNNGAAGNNLNGPNLNQSNSNDTNNNQTAGADGEGLAMSIMSNTDYNSDDQEFFMNPSDNGGGGGGGAGDGQATVTGTLNALDELSDNQDCCSDHLDSELAVGRCCDDNLQAFRNGAGLGGGGHNHANCYMDEYEYENISTIRHYPLPMTASSLQEGQQQQQFAGSANLVGAADQQQRPLDQTSASSYVSNSVIAPTGHLQSGSRVSTADESNDNDQYQMDQQQQQQQQQQQNQGADYDPLGLVLYESEQTIEHADHEEHNLLHNALMRSPEKLKLIDSIITLLNYASNYNQKMLAPLLEIKRCIERDLEVVLSDTNSSSQQQQCCNPTPTLKQQQHQDLVSASYAAGNSRHQQQQVAGADEQNSRREVSAMEMIVGEI